MKIAISSNGNKSDSSVSEVFGRCNYFFIFEIKGDKIVKKEVFENASVKQFGGTGVSAAQFVAEKGVDAVLTGNVGPRAKDVFQQFQINVFITDGTVEKALEKFIKENLKK